MTQMNPLEAWLAQEQEIQSRLDAGAGCGVAKRLADAIEHR